MNDKSGDTGVADSSPHRHSNFGDETEEKDSTDDYDYKLELLRRQQADKFMINSLIMESELRRQQLQRSLILTNRHQILLHQQRKILQQSLPSQQRLLQESFMGLPNLSMPTTEKSEAGSLESLDSANGMSHSLLHQIDQKPFSIKQDEVRVVPDAGVESEIVESSNLSRIQYHRLEILRTDRERASSVPMKLRTAPRPFGHQSQQKRIWKEKFDELLVYKQRYGHFNVDYDDNPNGLFHWVNAQRWQYKLKLGGKKSLINADRVSDLESIGFPWMRKISKCDEMYKNLCSHKNRDGTVVIRRQNSSISKWLRNQRRRHNSRDTGALTSEQVRLSNELGVDLEIEAEKEGTQKIQRGVESTKNTTPIQTTVAKAKTEVNAGTKVPATRTTNVKDCVQSSGHVEKCSQERATTERNESGEMVCSGGGTKFYSGIPLKHTTSPRSLAIAVPYAVPSNRESPDAVASVAKVSFDNELSRSKSSKEDNSSRGNENLSDDNVYEHDGYCSSDGEASLVF